MYICSFASTKLISFGVYVYDDLEEAPRVKILFSEYVTLSFFVEILAQHLSLIILTDVSVSCILYRGSIGASFID